MSADIPAHLSRLRDEVAATQVISVVDGPGGAWTFDGFDVHNSASDFFRITGHRTPDGREHLLIRQEQHALVGLVTARTSEGLHVLLTVRAEPGLHRAAQFSSTIQSTPSNYLRAHGGAATPFIDEVLTPPDDARVVHDSTQYDWGDYYHAKVKRFRIVELPTIADAPYPLVWVPLPVLKGMMAHDHLVTSDLRVATTMLLSDEQPSDAAPTPPLRHAEPLLSSVAIDELRGWRTEPAGLLSDTEDREILWVNTSSRTREVTSWVQPLMRLKTRAKASLPVRMTPAGARFAIRQATQSGLDGKHLWFPATPGGGEVLAQVSLSAEGGRFYLHTVDVSLVEASAVEDDVEWVSLATLESLAAASELTSLELRCLLSLAQTAGVR